VPTPNAPAEALLDRFVADCAVGPVARGDRIGIAVSGGPDSLALLLLAHGAFGAQVEAVTVDHGIRPESAGEAAFVASVCEKMGVSHTILELLRKPRKGNLSAKLRELRYAQMYGWAGKNGLNWLMTGHHADDQLETMIMRLNRGAGTAGLSAIRARNELTLRPLLGWRRSELAEIVRQSGLTPIDDPTNRDERFDRARLRKALADVDWLDPLAVNRTAHAMEEADAALAWAAWRMAKERCTQEGEVVVFDSADLPREIQRRIVLGCLRKLNAKASPGGPKLTRFHDGLERGKRATLEGIVGWSLGAIWRFEIAPPRRDSAN
jgi:tRNA(Ile)-lysidine synthase